MSLKQKYSRSRRKGGIKERKIERKEKGKQKEKKIIIVQTIKITEKLSLVYTQWKIKKYGFQKWVLSDGKIT